ncbi:MAG TPA: hypothetical protein H9900_03990 [Candidatus Monoglobus merdigallinarum]|uniref:DUF1540 domain-containing protein n=1 Tax=Candidatus Monoglobus merdigallinarum TaxID=2838698 RepID=A0A9D1TLH9_9FIRM|nr:hypothetical protein [Candidatus Monoglobus merdigallinarum]
MSNINCLEAECRFMADGKCTLNTVIRAAGIKDAGKKTVKQCPYFQSVNAG